MAQDLGEKSVLIEHPIFDQLAEGFKINPLGAFLGDPKLRNVREMTVQKYYGQPDVVAIVEASIRGALLSEGAKKIGLEVQIPKKEIVLQDSRCRVDAKVHIAKPLRGDISLAGVLTNAQEKGKLAWAEEPAVNLSFILKTALAAAGRSAVVDKQIRAIKTNPTGMIADVFRVQMGLRHVNITRCEMELAGRQLVTTLKGIPQQTQN